MARLTREELLSALENYYKEIDFGKIHIEDLQHRSTENLQELYDDAMDEDED